MLWYTYTGLPFYNMASRQIFKKDYIINNFYALILSHYISQYESMKLLHFYFTVLYGVMIRITIPLKWLKVNDTAFQANQLKVISRWTQAQQHYSHAIIVDLVRQLRLGWRRVLRNPKKINKSAESTIIDNTDKDTDTGKIFFNGNPT